MRIEPPSSETASPHLHARTLARRWLGLAVSSLLLSGLLALLLAAARTPFLDSLVADPLFFRRGLVVHVDLALLVWIYACVAALFALVPARRAPGLGARISPAFGLAGVMLLVAAAGAGGSKPVLSNYVPVIDHPLFLAGLATFAFGVVLAFADRRLIPSSEAQRGIADLPDAARVALRTAALAVFAALLCFAGSWVSTSRTLGPEAYYEHLFWGGGHVLQVASVAAMCGAWLTLQQPLSTREILPRRVASLLLGALLLPALLSPLLALQGPMSPWYRVGFTRLMQWGIFPATLVVMVACTVALVRAKARLSDGRVLGFVTSASLTLLGFGIGAMIRGPNTMVPAHYHAAIGAVTASFMAVAYPILPRLGIRVAWPRLSRVQPVVFGIGQAIFALGFGIAGHFGMGRKVYGAEQLHRSLPETIGLAVMGTGGLVAAVGGIAFLTIFLASWRRASAAEAAGRSEAWIPENGCTPSRS